ncbi:MAG: hypothetical protein QFX35_05230 [Candidatus Verstraetearchaeota archaeon]|nr:hypothetical protein [Candidatus Verstraetearchaeota archaeon]
MSIRTRNWKQSKLPHIDVKPVKCTCRNGYNREPGLWKRCTRCGGTGLTYEKEKGGSCFKTLGGCACCPFYEDCVANGCIINEGLGGTDMKSGI